MRVARRQRGGVRRDGKTLLASATGGAIGREAEAVEQIRQSEATSFHIGNDGTTSIRFELGERDAKDQRGITPPLGGPVRGVRVEWQFAAGTAPG